MTEPAIPPATEAGPATDDVARFLTEQAECLASGLEHAEDPLAVRAVLRSHDGAHDRWLRLISGMTSHDPGAADELAALYELHGRVAGSLERGGRRIGDRALQEHARALLAQQLRSTTARAVAALPA